LSLYFCIFEKNKQMKSKYFLRYRFILEKLQRSSFSDYGEIKQYIIDKFEILGYKLKYSKRTFQRDKKDIESIFNIVISYNRTDNAYFIDENDISDISQKLLDAYTVTNALQLYDDFSNYISFEKENLGNPGIFYDLNYTIKNRYEIKLFYQKYYSETYEEYMLKPLALKEFNRRWYLVACKKDKKTGKELIRTYGLDRIIKVEKQKAKFALASQPRNNKRYRRRTYYKTETAYYF